MDIRINTPDDFVASAAVSIKRSIQGVVLTYDYLSLQSPSAGVVIRRRSPVTQWGSCISRERFNWYHKILHGLIHIIDNLTGYDVITSFLKSEVIAENCRICRLRPLTIEFLENGLREDQQILNRYRRQSATTQMRRIRRQCWALPGRCFIFYALKAGQYQFVSSKEDKRLGWPTCVPCGVWTLGVRITGDVRWVLNAFGHGAPTSVDFSLYLYSGRSQSTGDLKQYCLDTLYFLVCHCLSDHSFSALPE